MRTPPVKHTVDRHTRDGKPVRSYRRGNRVEKKEATKRCVPLRIKSIPIDPHPHTPSGRPTDNLSKIAKDQTLLWEGKEGSQRIVLGHYRPRMKNRDCTYCDEYFKEGEEIVMAQDYFPFRGYFPTYSAYHKHHFPIKLNDPIQAEKDIEDYMNSTYEEPSVFTDGVRVRVRDIYKLEDEVRRHRFDKEIS